MTQITRSLHNATASPVVAVLYQAIEPPIINGARKPRKPGGITPHSCYPKDSY